MPPTIAEHCAQVQELGDVIWEEVVASLAQATGVSVGALTERLRPLLSVSAALHDFMKANSAFQEMLEALFGRAKTQPVRHEILAAIQITQNQDLRAWLLKTLSQEEIQSLAWAVGGHHFQMRLRGAKDTQDPMFRDTGVPNSVSVYLGHGQISTLLNRVRDLLRTAGLDPGPPPKLTDPPPYDPLDDPTDAPNGLEAMVVRLVGESHSEWKRWQATESFAELQLNLALLKVLLVAADIAGSALPGCIDIEVSPAQWIRTQLQNSLSVSNLDKIVAANLGNRRPRNFQRRVEASEATVTVVSAGCGNGKTTAAYMWAKRHAVGRKLFFTYPTTGTASAGFRDYLFAQTELERNLIHGRSTVDLQSMADSFDLPPIERAQRLESLNAWAQQVIACTADTVLGLIQNQRRPVFSFPAIIRGAFVFDEIHSYDRRMFAELLRFLKTFPGLPVLIMSASIPPRRLEKLRQVAGDRMNQAVIQGDTTLEQVKRYMLALVEPDECWVRAGALLTANDSKNAAKILWVCNTVGDAVKTWRAAKERFPEATVLLYHSRFRYGHRVALQDAVIDEFRYEDDAKTIRKCKRPTIAITTQVCEMSLDISADLLVSALCPLPSLIQRLGRLNRYATEDSPKPALVFPFTGRPYHEHDSPAHIEAAESAIEAFAGTPVSQEMLAARINELQSNEELPEYSAWLDGGWQSEPMPVREGDNSITLVREEDLNGLSKDKYGNYQKDDIIPLTIPMLFRRGFQWTDRAASYPIAPTGTVAYEESGAGAEWQNAKR
ncbi:MAG: CRISPR-associated helicase Cas3' [Planctomycetaceae bacterium]